MQEINVKGNETGLRVFIDGEPNLLSMPEEEINILATVLEMVISKQYENYTKRKDRDERRKKKMMSSDNT